MTFGICFGAALLTLLAMLPGVRFKSAAGNTILGVVAGVPLGDKFPIQLPTQPV
jgi:hypothetical protein